MASYTATTQYDNYTLRLDVSESNVNIGNNTSDVNWTLYIVNGGRRFSIGSFYYRVVINGTEVANFTGACNTTDVAVSGGVHYLASGTLTVGHDNDGSKTVYCYAECNGRANGHGPGWGALDGNFGLTSIPRNANITRADNFNSDWNPYMEFNNPGGLKVNLRLEFGGVTINRDNYYGSGGYTFQLSQYERNLLYSKCSNSNSLGVRFVVATCVGGGGETSWSWLDRTMTVVNSNPTFSNFTFEDINSNTVTLTGDNQKVINNYSNVKVTVPVANKATGNNYATIQKYQFNCGNKSTEFNYSDTSNVSATISGAPNGTFVVYARDSRGNSTSATKFASQLINYNPLTKGNISVARSNGISEVVTLQFSGTIDLVNFGQVTNSIKSAQYRYKPTDSSTWSDWNDISLNIDNSTFSFDDIIEGDTQSHGFDISNSYQIEVLVTDELSNVTFTETLGSGTPNIALAKNGVGIMGKYDDSIGGKLQINGTPVLIPYVLYNSSGTDQNVTLSDSAANYEYIEIYAIDNDSEYCYTKVYSPNGKKVLLNTAKDDGSFSYVKSLRLTISGTSITRGQLAQVRVGENVETHRYTQTGVVQFWITRVVGYKKV